MITSLQALVLFMGYHIVVSSTDWVRKENHAVGDESIVSRRLVPKYHQQAHDRFRRILKRQGQHRLQARRNYAIIPCERNHGLGMQVLTNEIRLRSELLSRQVNHCYWFD
jgi:hypothetical protein